MREEQQPNTGTPSPARLQVRRVSASRGTAWIAQAWRLFTMAPLVWVVNFLIFAIIMVVLSLVPVMNVVTNLLGPVFAGGLMLGARELDRGGELQVSHLFAGFSRRSGTLVGLGAVNMVMILIVLLLSMGLMMGGMADLDAQPDPAQMAGAQIAGLLVLLALLVPVIMLVWFAPALIVLNDDIGVFEAMKLSFSACLKNTVPFLLYGLVLAVLTFLAALPLGLGLLVLFPMVYASIYVSYKDIFLDTAE